MSDQEKLEAQAMEAQTPEKSLTQDEVNAVVGRAKREAAERARQQAEAEYQQKLEAMQSQAAAPNAPNPDVEYQRIAEQVRQELRQEQQAMQAELEERQLREHMSGVANTLESQLAKAKGTNEDYDQVMEGFDLTEFPQLAYLAHKLPNGGDIIVELARNPHKLASVVGMTEKSPNMAQKMLEQIGSSIAVNHNAKAEAAGQSTPAPLDRVTPSRVSGSSDEMNLSNLKGQSWLKG